MKYIIATNEYKSCYLKEKEMNVTPHFLKLHGGSDEIGYQHGSQLKNRVRAVWKFYSEIMFDNKLNFLRLYGDQYLQTIYSYNANYGVEIESLAYAAGLESWQIAALNARTELFHRLVDSLETGECTSAFLPKTRVLGQNWDWMEQLESLLVVMEIERKDGHRILQMTEPGIIGKIGLNSEGIGVCLNIISGVASPVSVPIHILLRTVLDSSSLENVSKHIESLQHGTYSNILAADANGQFVNFEFAGSTVSKVTFQGRPPLHTNHYLGEELECYNSEEDPTYPSSRARYSIGRHLLDAFPEDAGVPELQSLFRDTTHEDFPICKPYSNLLGFQVGTVSSLVMDLPNRTAFISIGNPIKAAFHKYGFN